MWALENGCVRFGETLALDHVTLSVSPGEIVVVLGPSGCGKSTLLRVIAGLQPLTSGTMSIDGADATNRAPHTRSIGMVFQDPTLFPHRNVADNVAFGLRMAGVDKPTRLGRVAEMLDLVGLHDFGERAVATLSGGEAQRVALARSLAPRPRLLLLDEPFAALDRSRRDALLDDLPPLLQRDETTAVHVTHDQDEAFALADRIAVMDHGTILRIDTPDRLFADPRTETVARFLGHRNIVGDGETRRVIRRDAASVDPAGDLSGTVLQHRFRGDHHEVRLATDLGDLEFQLRERVPVGSPIRLAIDPSRIAPIDPE